MGVFSKGMTEDICNQVVANIIEDKYIAKLNAIHALLVGVKASLIHVMINAVKVVIRGTFTKQ